MSNIPVTYTEAYGKKWIFVQAGMTLQCAYCIFVQPLLPVRDNTGLVTSVKLDPKQESHAESCPQSNKKV